MVLVVVIVALAALFGTSASIPTVAPSPVRCESIIYPDASAATWKPKRVVLGVVAVPPAHIPQTVRTDGLWPYWSKAGLVVRASSPPVLVRVPPAWTARAAITWGDGGPAAALRIRSCPRSGALGNWNPYSGGFLLSTKTACAPLTFTVSGRSATMRFGVGERCR
jgi:hypothetical protein